MPTADACGSDGFNSMLAVDTGGTPLFANYTSGSECWPLAGQCSLRRRKPKVPANVLNGTRELPVEMVRDGNHTIDGDIPLFLTPDAFQAFGPRILGGAWDISKNSIPTIAMPPEFHAMVHKDAYIYLYNQLRITQAVISGEVNNPLLMTLSCIGRARDETLQASGAWPSGLNPSLSVPYMFEDCVLTVGGVTKKCRKFSYTRNNNLAARFWGTRTACGIKANGPATNMLSLTLPHSTETVPSILQATQDGEYLSVVITGTHPTTGYSFSITLPGLQVPEDDPPVVAGEILLELACPAGSVAGGASVTFNNDNVL